MEAVAAAGEAEVSAAVADLEDLVAVLRAAVAQAAVGEENQ